MTIGTMATSRRQIDVLERELLPPGMVRVSAG